MQEVQTVGVVNIKGQAEEEYSRHCLSRMQEARLLCKSASVSWKYDPGMWILWKDMDVQRQYVTRSRQMKQGRMQMKARLKTVSLRRHRRKKLNQKRRGKEADYVCSRNRDSEERGRSINKRLATEEPAHKQTHIEEPVHEDPRKVVGAAGIRRRPTYTAIEPNKRKFQVRKRKILPRNLRHRC